MITRNKDRNVLIALLKYLFCIFWYVSNIFYANRSVVRPAIPGILEQTDGSLCSVIISNHLDESIGQSGHILHNKGFKKNCTTTGSRNNKEPTNIFILPPNNSARKWMNYHVINIYFPTNGVKKVSKAGYSDDTAISQHVSHHPYRKIVKTTAFNASVGDKTTWLA